MGKRCKRRDILKHVKRTVIFLYMCLSLAMVGYAYRAEDIYYCTTDAPQLLMVLGGTVLGDSSVFILHQFNFIRVQYKRDTCTLNPLGSVFKELTFHPQRHTIISAIAM